MNIWLFIITVSSLNLPESCYQGDELDAKIELITGLVIEINLLQVLNAKQEVGEVEYKKTILQLIQSISAENCCCIDACEYNYFVNDAIKKHSSLLDKIFY